MSVPNLKKLINEFVECGQEIMKLEKEYDYKAGDEIMFRYARTFKALIAERVRQNKIN